MPITKRLVMHGGQTGIKDGLDYVLDIKHNGKKYDNNPDLVSGLSCTTEFAYNEFLMNNRKHRTIDDDRSAYHVIQSFAYDDKLTANEVHEIGVKLAKNLYNDFQCVIVTHTDKICLHNHIIINATSLTGRKLEDRLSNKKEGLYGLREISDELALKYGAKIIENPPPIGKSYKGKDYLYRYANKSWKKVMIDEIEELKVICDSFDEMLKQLSLDGYQIRKRGKDISIKPFGAKRFARLHKIKSEYSENKLRLYFFNKEKDNSTYTFEEYININSEFGKLYTNKADLTKEAIITSGYGMMNGERYPKYLIARYLEMKKYNKLCKEIELLNNEEIKSYEDLIDAIQTTKNQYEVKTETYNIKKAEYDTLQAKLPLAKLYLENYNDYIVYEENVALHGKENVPMNLNVKIFLDVKEQLSYAPIDDVKEFVIECNRMKMDMNRMLASISYIQNRVSDLEQMRQVALDKDEKYIKSISFSNDMIDKTRSSKEYTCIKLPYTKKYVYLENECIVWTNYGRRATMYLIDDKEYDLYDSKDNHIETVKGEELENISNEEKENVKGYYKDLRVD